MEYRNLEIRIVSADNLPNVRRWGGKMRVYAVVSCNGVYFSTKIDMDKERHPRWRDDVFNFQIDEASVKKPGTHVVVRLYCKRTFHRDKPVGDEVAIEVKSLYDRGDRASVTETVPKAQGGTVNIMYAFGQVLVPKQRGLANWNWKKIFAKTCGVSVCSSGALIPCLTS